MTRLSALVLMALCVFAAPVAAEPAERAMAAARALENATRAMQAASGGRDQIAALSQTIQAYEDGLVALRDGLREAQLREAALTRSLNSQSADVSRLLAVLLGAGQFAPELVLLHPDGALATARAGMLLSDVTPELAAQVAELRRDLDDLRAVRRARQYGLLALEQGLEAVQQARIDLSAAIAARGPLPRKMVDAPERLALLANDAATLDEFAAELALRPATAGDVPVGALMAAFGTLPLPVRATILRRYNQSDAAGIERPGLVLATAPQALVIAPWSGTVRYAGPLGSLGQVVILEPAEDMLMILGGMGEILVQNGEILPAGTPLGTMPARSGDQAESGQRNETLYFEFRQAGNPIDPEPWFAFTAP
jgi:murein hydrolase activator